MNLSETKALNNMFMFDIETLGKKSDAVILSIGCIYFDPDVKYSYADLVNQAFFVKFDAKDQMKRLHRSVNKSTIDWWAKQCDIVRRKSFTPHETDMKFEHGYDQFRAWANFKNDSKCAVWARGTLDQLVLDDIQEQIGLEPIFHYARWRDVRTAIDLLYNTQNGYCKVKDFDSQAHVYKHDPVHDCAFDVMQLLYGVSE